MKPVIERPLRGTHLTLIGAISLDGAGVLEVMEGSVDGPRFVAWLDEVLGPTLCPDAVVIMDGPRLHRVAGVAEVLAKHGATPLYLPPYSPELNAIESAWGWVKAWLRKAAVRELSLLRTTVVERWGAITPALTTSWIRHAGYAGMEAA